MLRSSASFFSFALMAAAAVDLAHAQDTPSKGGSIYTCTDARGRTITADRPIAECLDREQRELGPSGTTRRRIEPTYTAREQAERDERERKAQFQQQRVLEEKRRERALAVRYPNQAAHDRERGEALVQIDAVIHAARKRIGELNSERQRINDELEFYVKNPKSAPASLRRKLDDNVKSVAVQNRFIDDQEDEKKRVNARFDEERARLRPLWGPTAATPTR